MHFIDKKFTCWERWKIKRSFVALEVNGSITEKMGSGVVSVSSEGMQWLRSS